MLKKVILTIFRTWVGLIGFTSAFAISESIKNIRNKVLNSEFIGVKIYYFIAMIILFYILGLIIEKGIDVLTGYKIEEGLKEEYKWINRK